MTACAVLGRASMNDQREREPFDGLAYARMIENDHARRELLWLRAQEKEDEWSMRDLERVDPDLVDRLRAAGCDVEEHPGELPRERSERFGRFYDERLHWHMRMFARRQG
jgi:hypothetical protein